MTGHHGAACLTPPQLTVEIVLTIFVTFIDSSRGWGTVFTSICLCVCRLFFCTVSQQPTQPGSPNLTQKCSEMSPGNPFILGSNGQTWSHESQKTLSALVLAFLWVLASSSLFFVRLYDIRLAYARWKIYFGDQILNGFTDNFDRVRGKADFGTFQLGGFRFYTIASSVWSRFLMMNLISCRLLFIQHSVHRSYRTKIKDCRRWRHCRRTGWPRPHSARRLLLLLLLNGRSHAHRRQRHSDVSRVAASLLFSLLSRLES